ncbi:MAG: prolyl-tRNA synthetase associated domain-containing protein [Pseudomonadota bacterium]
MEDLNSHNHPDHQADRLKVEKRLSALGIDCTTVTHPPIMTVEEGRSFKESMPGGHSKNLFVKDKRAEFSLVVAHCDTKVDLVGVGKALGSKGRLSFGKPEAMVEILGVEPGSVTPFSLMNASPSALARVVIDKNLMGFDQVWFHPLRNTASTAIKPEDLVVFAEDCGFPPVFMDLAQPLEGETSPGGAP